MNRNCINDLFDHIYVLYITEGERLRIVQKLKKNRINAQLFLGVNGKEIKHGTKLNDGSYGHSASFIKIIEDAKENKYDRILILEPDIYFCQNFEDEIMKYAHHIKDSQLIYLGGSQYMYYREQTWDQIKITGDSYKAYKTLGTFALGLYQDIYDKYLSLLKLFKYPSDVCLAKLQEDQNLKSTVIYPNLICCDITQSSTSEAERPKQIEAIKNYRWSKNYDFEDEYYVQTKENNWYCVEIKVNSFLNGYQIHIDNLPVIRDLRLIRTLNRDHEEKIFFKASSHQCLIKLNRLFGKYEIKETTIAKVRSSMSKTQLDRMIGHPLADYYLSDLYRALSK